MKQPADRFPIRAWFFGLAMAACFAVYAFMSVAHACGPWRGPPPPPTQEQRAFEALKLGQLKTAVALFAEVGHHEWVARLRFQFGTEAKSERRYLEAERELRAALAANPAHVGAIAELVDTLRLRGRHDAALAIAAGPIGVREPMVRAMRAQVLYDVGDFAGARSVLAALVTQGRLPTAARGLWNTLGPSLRGPGALGRI